jgi:ppGpp synthetase/RelA/SpoT-type nucleotidyltranferase
MDTGSEERVQAYQKIRPLFEGFTKKLKTLLEDLIGKEGIEYHLVEARTKSYESFREKITRPDKNYNEPLKEITDLAGLRVSVYYLDDVKRVAKLVEEEFVIDWPNSVDKGTQLKPNEFGYRSLHYVVSLSETRRRLAEWEDFKDLKAEIQIRTVLQHAWAAIDHALRYKKESDVPSQLRRRLYRLSGLLELADEEFSSLKEAQRSLREEFRNRLQKKDVDLEVNVITLWEYIEISKHVACLVDVAKKSGAKIRPPKEYDLSELVTYCSDVGITRISELDTFLKGNLDCVPSYFGKLMSSHSLTTNASYLIIYLLIPSHPSIFTFSYMKKKRWREDMLKSIFVYGKELRENQTSQKT